MAAPTPPARAVASAAHAAPARWQVQRARAAFAAPASPGATGSARLGLITPARAPKICRPLEVRRLSVVRVPPSRRPRASQRWKIGFGAGVRCVCVLCCSVNATLPSTAATARATRDPKRRPPASRRDPDARCSLRDSVRSVYARARRSVARCIIGVNVCIHTGTASSERSSSSAGTAEASCKGPMRSASRVSASPDRLQTASRRRYANTASWSGVWHLRARPSVVPRAGPSRLSVRRPASTLTRSDVRRELSRVYSQRRDAQRFGRRSSDMIAGGARPVHSRVG